MQKSQDDGPWSSELHLLEPMKYIALSMSFYRENPSFEKKNVLICMLQKYILVRAILFIVVSTSFVLSYVVNFLN